MDRVGFNKKGEILIYKNSRKVMRITLGKDHILFDGLTEKESALPMSHKAYFRDIKVIRLGSNIVPLAKKDEIRRMVFREFLAASYYTKTDVSSQCSGAVDCIMRILQR